MLKIIASSLLAAASFVATYIPEATIRPIETATAEFFILGQIPFVPFQLTFEPMFVGLLAFALYKVIKSLRKIAGSIVKTRMWNPQYLDQISI